MKAINAALASARRTQSFSLSSLETVGYVTGRADGREDQPYDDGHVVPHRFIVFVPDIGPSLFAIGYRRGYAEGQAERVGGGSLNE